jgi:hypothetical protein
MINRILSLLFIASLLVYSQQLPLEKNGYMRLTSYSELTEFVKQLDNTSDLLNVKAIGQSVEGRDIYGMFFSKDGLENDNSRISIMFFAQQHGNEQSGKEGALLLASELIKEKYNYLFDKIDFVLIPQMNPDGSEKDKRYNSNNTDLNRNHLILTEPETVALHKLFNEYLFDVTLDVHEYYPYSNSWKEYGYYKRADEQFGILTNPNVSDEIRRYSKEHILPHVKKSLEDKGFSCNEYIVGGPPDRERLRHSTVDIDDGRQSMGIQNTFSFILEGKNGKESVDNIKHRAEGQFNAMLSLLNFVYENADDMKKTVKAERDKLLNKKNSAVIRMEHADNQESILLPVTDSSTGKDTMISLSNYHNKVVNLLEAALPDAYMIPAADSLLMDFVQKHNIRFNTVPEESYYIEGYNITRIDTIELEELKKADVKYSVRTIETGGNYIYIPVNQLKKNTIALAFEPQSMLALLHYDRFSYLTKNKEYPVLRGVRIKPH